MPRDATAPGTSCTTGHLGAPYAEVEEPVFAATRRARRLHRARRGPQRRGHRPAGGLGVPCPCDRARLQRRRGARRVGVPRRHERRGRRRRRAIPLRDGHRAHAALHPRRQALGDPRRLARRATPLRRGRRPRPSALRQRRSSSAAPAGDGRRRASAAGSRRSSSGTSRARKARGAREPPASRRGLAVHALRGVQRARREPLRRDGRRTAPSIVSLRPRRADHRRGRAVDLPHRRDPRRRRRRRGGDG